MLIVFTTRVSTFFVCPRCIFVVVFLYIFNEYQWNKTFLKSLCISELHSSILIEAMVLIHLVLVNVYHGPTWKCMKKQSHMIWRRRVKKNTTQAFMLTLIGNMVERFVPFKPLSENYKEKCSQKREKNHFNVRLMCIWRIIRWIANNTIVRDFNKVKSKITHSHEYTSQRKMAIV